MTNISAHRLYYRSLGHDRSASLKTVFIMKGRVPTGFSIETMSVCCVISWIMLSVLVFAPGCSASLDEGRALLKDIASFLFRKILPIAQDVFIESDISSECSGSLLKFMSAIRRSEPWALKSEYLGC